jgi:hypothetical protein
MARTTRSARGEVVDFELLAIKAQLASAPVPKAVEQRKVAIDLKDGVKTDVVPDLNMDIFAVSTEAAKTSASTGKQIKKK